MVQLGIAEGLPIEDQRRGPGCAAHLVLEEFRQAGLGDRPAGGVEGLQERVPLRVPQPAQPVQRFVGSATAIQQATNRSLTASRPPGPPRRVIVEAQQQRSPAGPSGSGDSGWHPASRCRRPAAPGRPPRGLPDPSGSSRNQQGVEEVAAAGGPQDLGQPEVLVREQSRVALLEVGQERARESVARRRTRSGRVLMNRPTIRSTPGRPPGGPRR